MRRFPQRRFILVGDSGESDPALYARLARQFPSQIQSIYLRNVANTPAADFAKCFSQLPGIPWQIFRKPGEIRD